MDKQLFEKKLSEMSSTIDKEYCKDVIRKSLRDIPENQNQKGTMNVIIIMEELSELIKELSKIIRGKGERMALIEELADVALCINYIQEIFDVSDDILARAINVKLYRQDQRNGFENKEDEIKR